MSELEMVFSVSEFNEVVGNHLGLLGQVQVEGELSEWKISQGKWIFGTLVDENSNLNLFGMTFRLRNFGQFEGGMRVRVLGSPSLHQRSGRFSFTVNQIMPVGEGALAIAYEKLKAQLVSEGLHARKRALPHFPEKIGLITAKGSAAYADFVKILGARTGGVRVLFYPVSVQGATAAPSLKRAIRFLDQENVEVLVITRGGGSLEDLAAFSDEGVARAVFASQVPTVSAVGHETDETLVDLVSDLRASTPSNAAELIVRDKVEVIGGLERSMEEVNNFLHSEIGRGKEQVGQLVDYLRFVPSRNKERLGALGEELVGRVAFQVSQSRVRMESLVRLLESVDYRNVLKRGFSVTFDKSSGRVVKRVGQVERGVELETELARGKLLSIVK